MAVSIWEGNKAQALIDAINGNQKVSIEQGTGNSGKVMAVGSDGKVVPAYTILPDAVKNALMDCFAHVLWDDDSAESTYGKALRDALYIGVDENIVFSLPSHVNSSTFSYNTGIVPKLKEDFTVLIHATWTNLERQSFVLDARNLGQNIVSQRIQANYDAQNNTIAFRSAIAVSGGNIGGNTPAYSVNTDHDVKFVVRNNGGLYTFRIYVDNALGYTLDRQYALENDATTDYAIGNVHNTGTDTIKPWSGTYHFYKIYNVALSNQEIEDLIGVNISA